MQLLSEQPWPLFIGFLVMTLWLAVTDLRSRRIPNAVLGGGYLIFTVYTLGAWLCASAQNREVYANKFAEAMLVLVVTLLFACVLGVLGGGALGMGDIKLLPLAAAIPVWYGGIGAAGVFFVALAVVTLLSLAGYYLVCMFSARNLQRLRAGASHMELPFAPLILAASWMAILTPNLF